MTDFKMKLVLSGLGGIMLAFIFILLSFALPTKTHSKTAVHNNKSKNKLEIISNSLNK